MSIKDKYNVIVIGAGISGVSAAVKAARSGVSVLLIEQYGFIGGMSTAGMVSPFMKHSVNGETLVRGVFEDLEINMRNINGMIDNGFYASALRTASYNLLIGSRCDVLLNSVIFNVESKDRFVKSIDILSNGKQLSIKGDIFIDTSGDAQLVYLGGFSWAKGDETSGKMQALTLFFRMADIDIQKVTDYASKNKNDFFGWMDYNFDLNKIISIAGFFSNVKKAITEGRLPPEVNYIFFTTLPESGEASFNTSNILGLDGSTSLDLTKAELEGRRQVRRVVELLQDEIPGFENSFLLETAVQVGVRETRRAVGDYIVTGDDIRYGRKFPDAIARGCYGIDIHGQKDEESKMENLPEGAYYEIPRGSIIVRNSENLLVAGRCISATREGHGALRIMPTSAATGEACGAWAALAVKNNKKLREINHKVLQELVAHNISLKN